MKFEMFVRLAGREDNDQPLPFYTDDRTKWTVLKQLLASYYGEVCPDRLDVRYWDDEDYVIISSQEELEEAFRLSEEKSYLQLDVKLMNSDGCHSSDEEPVEHHSVSTDGGIDVEGEEPVDKTPQRGELSTEGRTDPASTQHSRSNAGDTGAMEGKPSKKTPRKKSLDTVMQSNTDSSFSENIHLLDYLLKRANMPTGTDSQELCCRQSMDAAAFASLKEMEMEAGEISFDDRHVEKKFVEEEVESADREHVMLPGALSGANVIAIEMPETEHQGTETAEPAEIAETGEVSPESSRDAETGFWMQPRLEADGRRDLKDVIEQQKDFRRYQDDAIRRYFAQIEKHMPGRPSTISTMETPRMKALLRTLPQTHHRHTISDINSKVKKRQGDENRRKSSPATTQQMVAANFLQQKKQERRCTLMDSRQKKKKHGVDDTLLKDLLGHSVKKREKVRSTTTLSSSSPLETPSEDVSSGSPPSPFPKKHERKSSKDQGAQSHKKKKHHSELLTEDAFVRYMTKFESQLKKDMVKEVAKKTAHSVIKNLPKQNEDGENGHTQPAISSKRSGFVHEDIICDCCDREIVGTRYICGNCSNYDLCEECENIQPSFHDRSHVFIKLRRPCLKAGTHHGVRVPLLKRIIYEPKEEERKVDPDRIQVIMERTKAQEDQTEGHLSRNNNNNEEEEQTDQPEELEQREMQLQMETSRKEYEANICDATSSYNEAIAPGEWVKKHWLVQNTGTAAWSTSVKLIKVSGEMSTEKTHMRVQPIKPGEHTVVSISMTSWEEGEHAESWQLYDCGWFGPVITCNLCVKKPEYPVTPSQPLISVQVPEPKALDLSNKSATISLSDTRITGSPESTALSDTRATGSPESVATTESAWDAQPDIIVPLSNATCTGSPESVTAAHSDTKSTGSPESVATAGSTWDDQANYYNIPPENATQSGTSAQIEGVANLLNGWENFTFWLADQSEHPVPDEDAVGEAFLRQTSGRAVLPHGEGRDTEDGGLIPEHIEDGFVLCPFAQPSCGKQREMSPASSIEMVDNDHLEMPQTELYLSQLPQVMNLNLSPDGSSDCQKEVLEEAPNGGSSFSSLTDESSSEEDFFVIVPDCFDTSKPLNLKSIALLAHQEKEIPNSLGCQQKAACSDTSPLVSDGQPSGPDVINVTEQITPLLSHQETVRDKCTFHKLVEDTNQTPCDQLLPAEIFGDQLPPAEMLDDTVVKASPGKDSNMNLMNIPQLNVTVVTEEAKGEDDEVEEKADMQEEDCSAEPDAHTEKLTRADSSNEPCTTVDHSLEQGASPNNDQEVPDAQNIPRETPSSQDPEKSETQDVDETDLKHYSEPDGGAVADADCMLDPNQQLNQMMTNTFKKASSGLQHLFQTGKDIFKTLQRGDSYEHKESTYEFKPSTYKLPENTWQPSNKEYVPPKSNFQLKSSEYQLPKSTFTVPQSQIPAGMGYCGEFAGPLQRIREMGYFNNERILGLLRKHGGDVQKVVNEIIEENDNDWAENRHGNH